MSFDVSLASLNHEFLQTILKGDIPFQYGQSVDYLFLDFVEKKLQFYGIEIVINTDKKRISYWRSGTCLLEFPTNTLTINLKTTITIALLVGIGVGQDEVKYMKREADYEVVEIEDI